MTNILSIVTGQEKAPGPIDAEARTLLDRVLEHKPLTVGIVWQNATSAGFWVYPPIPALYKGLDMLVAEIMHPDDGGEE